ncbi:Bug family tripartite tricarboxylate transporter substrate binding protein [Comamonas sp. J-3]|uniref:Bug family tripartite tricarboxylate transporter substrate binding protein n=1 Tax=Comamonas trifloxystrobinivorans TaxID=3350256 RepID=UPI0037283138
MNLIPFPRQTVLLGALLAAATCHAFPDKTVTIIVPFAAGGSGDLVSRAVADQLSAKWGKPVIVENRPGAGGQIGTSYVARQPADGHTILMQSPATMISAELLRDNAGYKTLKEFTAVTEVFSTPVVLVASAKTRARDFSGFINEARANEKLSFASHGQGSSTHYFGEQFKAAAHAPMVHVPVGGEGQMITYILGGHVSSGFVSVSGAQKAVEAGGAWVVAVSGLNRWSSLPQVPTFHELGLEGLDRMSGMSYLVRSNTPPEITQKLSVALRSAIDSPKTQESSKSLGVKIGSSTPEVAQEGLKKEFADWQSYVLKFGNLTETK